MDFAEHSFDVHAQRFMLGNVTRGTQPLEESVFFFAMKNALIDMSNYYFEQVKDL